MTRQSNDLNRITGCLVSAGIRYTTKTNSSTNLGRHHGIPNIKSDYAYEYRVYVHKKDYERAVHAIRQ